MSVSDESATTVIIRRPTMVKTNGRGRTVWVGPIEETELDLMSTEELKLALQAANDDDRGSIRAVAESGKNGIVARDRATGLYDVISDAELRDLMATNTGLSASIRCHDMVPESADDSCAAELSLVSTQALKQILNEDDSEDLLDVLDDNPGCDPYDNG